MSLKKHQVSWKREEKYQTVSSGKWFYLNRRCNWSMISCLDLRIFLSMSSNFWCLWVISIMFCEWIPDMSLIRAQSLWLPTLELNRCRWVIKYWNEMNNNNSTSTVTLLIHRHNPFVRVVNVLHLSIRFVVERIALLFQWYVLTRNWTISSIIRRFLYWSKIKVLLYTEIKIDSSIECRKTKLPVRWNAHIHWRFPPFSYRPTNSIKQRKQNRWNSAKHLRKLFRIFKFSPFSFVFPWKRKLTAEQQSLFLFWTKANSLPSTMIFRRKFIA